MKNAFACDMFAHALCNEHSRRRLAVAAALRRPTKDASLHEACLDGVAEIFQLIRRVTDIMVEAIKQSKKRDAYQSPVSGNASSNQKLRLKFR